MGIKSFVKNTVATGFNVKKWVDYDHLKETSKTVGGVVGALYTNDEKNTVRKETFEQAVRRLRLSEADIQQRMKSAYRFALSCLAGIPFVWAYAFYLFHSGLFLAGMVAVIMSALLGTYSFREHFNYFQMKQRRLGCTLKEWCTGFFKR